MKGTLNKITDKFYVDFINEFNENDSALVVYSEQINLQVYDQYVKSIEGKEVEFELIHTPFTIDGVSMSFAEAKLINFHTNDNTTKLEADTNQ